MRWVEQGAGVAWGALMESAHLASCLLAAVVRCPLQRGRSSLRGVAPVWLAPSHPCPGQARHTHGHPLPPAPPGSWYLACGEGRRGPHMMYLHLLALQCLVYKYKRSQRKEVPRSTATPPPHPSPPSLPSSPSLPPSLPSLLTMVSPARTAAAHRPSWPAWAARWCSRENERPQCT